MPPSILIVDANPHMRRTIRYVVEQGTDLRVCGEVGDGPDAIEKARELEPDLVVLDVSTSTMNGFQLARTLKRLVPKARLVLFSLEDNAFLRKAAAAAGIEAVASKIEGRISLFQGLRVALNSVA